ncbi:MAG: peptidyl-tRNA hydrolase [Crocinitomicaceae bacterium]|nr:MAG: peptidyl-tRNA hydrolase [Crocinitomicaceae bacterium]
MSDIKKEAKQVLIWRNDLRNTHGQKVRTGKIAAQLAHSTWAAVLNSKFTIHDKENKRIIISYADNPAMEMWFAIRFKKTALKCESFNELMEIYNKAKLANLPCCLITDAGLTEFEGSTVTSVAIGPAWPEEIDPITGHLSTL